MKRKKGLLILIIFVYFLSTVFFIRIMKMNDEEVKVMNVSAAPSYYMKLKENQVIIYNSDHSIYEFTDLNPLVLPDALVLELIEGKYFHNQEELYEFLETYTS